MALVEGVAAAALLIVLATRLVAKIHRMTTAGKFFGSSSKQVTVTCSGGERYELNYTHTTASIANKDFAWIENVWSKCYIQVYPVGLKKPSQVISRSVLVIDI